MAINFLEQLVAEWYEYQGYFVRRNVYVGKRPKGGYECELDVVAFHPGTKHLVHFEPSTDAGSWEERERRYKRKFEAGRKHIPSMFAGIMSGATPEIEQIALLVFAPKNTERRLAGGRVLHVSVLLTQIIKQFSESPMVKKQVPEQFSILRTLQFVTEYRKLLLGRDLSIERIGNRAVLGPQGQTTPSTPSTGELTHENLR
jgi:hypothetical protein